jgi:hypothetical protein
MTTVAGQNVLILDGESTITGRGALIGSPSWRSSLQFFEAVNKRFGGDGLVFFSERDDTVDRLGLDRDTGPWKVTGSDSWHIARKGSTYVRLGHLGAIDPDTDPLIVPGDPIRTAVLHQWFIDLVGTPFYGEGGTTSAILLDATVSVKGQEPLRRWDDPKAPDVRESPWLGPWQRECDCTGMENHVTLDRNAQYLSAAGGATLPLDALREHHGPPQDLRDAIGYWRIQIPQNPEPRLPHPCGPQAVPGEWAWVTSPTAEFLAEMGAEVKVASSWTCPRNRSRRLLRGQGKWYDRLRDARAILMEGDGDDDARVLRAVKDTYTRGVVTFGKHSGRWYRPDWSQIIRAEARVSMWRAVFRIGITESLWPVSTSTDAATYSLQPASARIGTGMGEWKVAG